MSSKDQSHYVNRILSWLGPRRKILIVAAAVLLAVVIAPYLRSVIFSNVYSGFAQPACCTSGRNGGNPENQGTRPESNRVNGAIDVVLKYYQQKYTDSPVTASAKAYCCYIEVIINKSGQPIKDLTYVNGIIYEHP
jgi:hypothetical protein